MHILKLYQINQHIYNYNSFKNISQSTFPIKARYLELPDISLLH